MGIFGSVFGKKDREGKQKEELPWTALERVDQLEGLLARSSERPQLIFKHSASCGISRMVLDRFGASYDPQWECDLHFLVVQANRELSKAIADKFGVRHESPQLLIIRDGQVGFHTSHGAIVDSDLGRHL